MQDNLEFLQWSKRYWDQYYPGGDYDALARRKGAGGAAGGGAPAASSVSSRTSGAGAGAGAAAGAARRGTTPTTTPGAKSSRPAGGAASAAVISENTQLKQTVEGLERERDFYFSKLRDIELLIQQAVEVDPEIEKDEEGLIKHIQAILYSTEVCPLPVCRGCLNIIINTYLQEGFEIPAEAEEGAVDDQETF